MPNGRNLPFPEALQLEVLTAEELLEFLNYFIQRIAALTQAENVFAAARDAWLDFHDSRRIAGGAAPAAATAELARRRSSTSAPPPAPGLALAAAPAAPPPRLRLQLQHACQAQSCGAPGCVLCAHNPTRRCGTNFREPPFTYTVDEVIHSPCGATLEAVLVDETGATVESGEEYLGYSILLTLVDDRRYQDLMAAAGGAPAPGHLGQALADPPVDTVILQTQDGRPILRAENFNPLPPGQAAPAAYNGALASRFQSARTLLSGLRSTKSCEALMPGKRPGMRLLARIVNPLTFQPEHKIAGFLSEPFVITTNRAKGRGEGTLLRTAPVQRLPGVGTETARKLRDFAALKSLLPTQAPTPEAQELEARVGDAVETVGDMKRVLDYVHTHPSLVRALRTALKIPDEMRWAELEQAVEGSVLVDNRVRAFECPAIEGELYLLFSCASGRVNFAKPLGLYCRRSPDSDAFVFTPATELRPANVPNMAWLAQHAAACWLEAGHPGWFSTDWDSQEALAGQLVGAHNAAAFPRERDLLTYIARKQLLGAAAATAAAMGGAGPGGGGAGPSGAGGGGAGGAGAGAGAGAGLGAALSLESLQSLLAGADPAEAAAAAQQWRELALRLPGPTAAPTAARGPAAPQQLTPAKRTVGAAAGPAAKRASTQGGAGPSAAPPPQAEAAAAAAGSAADRPTAAELQQLTEVLLSTTQPTGAADAPAAAQAAHAAAAPVPGSGSATQSEEAAGEGAQPPRAHRLS